MVKMSAGGAKNGSVVRGIGIVVICIGTASFRNVESH